MSNYTKIIIFILILVLISAVIVFLDSSVDNMNKLMPDISDGIVNGDKDYNDAVELVNDKNYNGSMNKALSAEENYNASLNNLKLLKGNFTSDVSDVHKEYINATIQELELKLKAVDYLKESIGYFEINSNYTGTNHASQANDLIYESLEYQNQRDSLVDENPNLFKQNFII